jgi:hypothetical protein
MGRARVVCQEHGTSNPCPGCSADHLLGDHATKPRPRTCRRCRAAARAATTPDRPDPPPPRPRLVPDYAALAAHDDTLPHLTEV